MNNLFTSTTVLLTEELVKSCSKEILQSKLTKLRLVTGIQFSKANKSYAVTGSWDQVDAAFEILTHWQAYPDHEPDFENALDGKITKVCQCDTVERLFQKYKRHGQSESESRQQENDNLQPLKSTEADNTLIEQTVEILEEEYANLKDKLKFRRKDLKKNRRKCEISAPDHRTLKCKILNQHRNEVEQNGQVNSDTETDKNTHDKLNVKISRRPKKASAVIQNGDERFTVAQRKVNSANPTSINGLENDESQIHSVGIKAEPTSISENLNRVSNKCADLVKSNGDMQIASKKTATKKQKKPGDKGYWSRAKRNDGDLSHHCKECNVTLKSRKRYLEHMRRIHIKEYQCKVCEKRFGYPTDLHRHKCPGEKVKERNNTTVTKQYKAKPAASSDSVEFECLECNYTTPVKMRLSCHIQRTHRKEFACDECDRRFGYSKDLLKHKQNIHSGTEYFCDQCSKMYKSKQIFESHLKTHESGYVKPFYNCDHCSKSLTSKYSLDVHMKTVHLGLKKVYLCQMCGKKFSQRSSYKQHCNAHNGIKPYKCDICEKAFVYHKSLKEHKFMHDNIRRFPCTFCEKAFRQRTTLHIHLKTHKTVKDHVCSVCGRGFAQKQAMERHERIHSGLRPYTCLVCNKSFGDTSTIRRHMISIHQKTETDWREDILSTVKKKSDYYVIGGTGQNRVYKSNPSKNSPQLKKKTTLVSPPKPMQAQTVVQSAQTELVQREPSLIVVNPIQNNLIQDPKFDYVNAVNNIQGPSLNGNASSSQNFQTFQTLQPGTIYTIATSQPQQNQQQNQNCGIISPVPVNSGFSQVIDFSTMTFLTTKLPNQSNDKVENGEQDNMNIQVPMQVQGQNTNTVQNATIVPLTAVSECLKVGQSGPSTPISADSSLSQAIASIWGFVGYPSYQSPGNGSQYQPPQNQ